MNESTLTQINDFLEGIRASSNKQWPDLEQRLRENRDVPDDALLIDYVIRFDNKGFKVFDFSTLLRHYREAGGVEKIYFGLSSLKSKRTNQQFGKSIEVCVNAFNDQECKLIVQDDDLTWVDSNFLITKEIIGRFKNFYWLIRSDWTRVIVHFLGLVITLSGSWFLAGQFFPISVSASSFYFSFALFLILFSNISTFVYPAVLKIIDHLFPNIVFLEKRKMFYYQLLTALVSAVFLYVCAVSFNKVIYLIGKFAQSFINRQ